LKDKTVLPLGKLPPDLLERIISNAPISDPRVLLGPGIGLDCAVIDNGESWLVLKSDPITFATDEIGWYAVQISANDIATTGAKPRWYLATVLLPENKTTVKLVEDISSQLYDACRKLDISFVGGHTEVTHGIARPIIMGTMIGEVAKDRLVTPRGSAPGDLVLLTKGVPIEATSLLAREFPGRLRGALTDAQIAEAANYLHKPGISITRDAHIAVQTGQVTAMHDPTEGGLAAALWELARASGHTLEVDTRRVIVPALSGRICDIFGLDPLSTIASGALLMTVKQDDAIRVASALEEDGIACSVIGRVLEGEPQVWVDKHTTPRLLDYPTRDEITRAYEQR